MHVHSLSVRFVSSVLFCASALPSFAGLVAKWDFNNYDPLNPTATNILAATVGDAGKPCYYAGKGTALVTDGTLGNMYVVAPDYAGDDASVTNAAAGLGQGNYALAIPKSSHVALPIPDAVKNHTWTMKIRCWYPDDGIWHAFFNRTNTTDSDLFLTAARSGRTTNGIGGGSFANGNNYKYAVSPSAWHTITVSAGEKRRDVFVDEINEGTYYNAGDRKDFFAGSEALTVIDGVGHILLCADDNGEDNLMYIDYVELYDEASVYEGKLPHYSKAGLTGEWTFPAGNVEKATVGNDLEKWTRDGQTVDFTEGTDGVLPGDGYVRAGQNNGFKCYHNLTNNSSYTVVMDVRIPDNANKTQQYHGFLQGEVAANGSLADGPVWISGNKGIYMRYKGNTYGSATGVQFGEWMRVAVTYNKTANKSEAFVNGVKNVSKSGPQATMAPKKGGYFVLLGDNSGEDYDVDISYAAFYDRVLTDAEIAELHSRPLAQKADGTFVPTVAPAGVWTADGNGGLAASKGNPLMVKEGGYEWLRSDAPAAATYVFDLTLPAVQTDGGTLVKNASNVASGIYGTGSTYSGSFTTTTTPATFIASSYVSTWGHWSENALDRSTAHRVAVSWTTSGRVHYYVDGRPWGQLYPWSANASLVPTATMNFLNDLGADVTRLAAYDAALTPDEVASLGDASTVPVGNAPNAPTVSMEASETPVKAMVDVVTFTVSATHPDGEYVSFAIDYGDGTGEGTTELVPSGTSLTFEHVFAAGGTITPRVKAISQNGVESAWVSATPVEVELISIAASDVLVTWPWQQNVYTNRFTIMCEGVKDAEDATRWDGLEVQYGAGYAQRATMTRVEGNGGTWIYTAHITVDGMDGETIPYRLGYYGLPLSYEDAADNTEGTVSLWAQSDNESFTCAVWGDNQQGLRPAYHGWDDDIFLYVTRIFEHAVSRDVDFGIATGDMASSADYENQIRPCILDRTDAIFGRTRPYYVAWGNHDTSYPNDKPYFETGAVDEPAYGTSASGNYYLYRGNVLFVFIDHSLMTAAATQTWLANLLATDRARGAKFRVLVQHIPFWLEHWGGNSNTALLETAKAGGIDLVLSGHMHGYERIHKDGIVQLTNGGAGYLDHEQNVTVNYGDATFLGGHRDVPYLFARQNSPADVGVLGPAMPVRMGLIQGYGELKVDGATLTYSAHGFNADGSYIGVFDEFSITSRTVAAVATSATLPTPCADPSSFAQFTSAPVTNAKWKEYKDAAGEAFTYAEGAGGDPVVNVSKNEIEKFIAWLNDAGGDYRLPTVAELETAFGGTMRREVAEWTSTVDPYTGWCRILGSPACAANGTWMRAADKPSIATAGCHANYLGFRLATGAAPAEPAAPDAPLAPALAALAEVADPAAVYKWENGALVDITSDWASPSGDLAYTVPVIFTGSGALSYEFGTYSVTLAGGLAAPNCTQLMKSGSGAFTVKGAVKGGTCDSATGWVIASEGALALEDVSFAGSGVSFRSGDRILRLKGDNDFSGADIYFDNESNNCTNYVAAVATSATLPEAGTATTLRARRMSNGGINPFAIGENVTVVLTKDYLLKGTYNLSLDGTIEAEAFNVTGNHDPILVGSGTLSIGSIGVKVRPYIRLGVSNLVFTTERPFRAYQTGGQNYHLIILANDTMKITSTCDWHVPGMDTFSQQVYFVADGRPSQGLCTRPKVTFDGPYDLVLSPAGYVYSGFSYAWDINWAGTGTLTVQTPTKGDIAVANGFAKISALPCDGATSTSGSGKWQIDGTLSLSAGEQISGAFVAGGTLHYDFGANGAGEYTVLEGCNLSEGDIAVTTTLDDSAEYAVTCDWSGGNLKLIVMPAGSRIADWTGGGAAGNPLAAANWRVTDAAGNVIAGAVPNSSTYIRLSGTTAMSFPATEGFEFAGLLLAEDVALAADCDWTGLGTVAFRDGAWVDLRGHRLDVAGFSGVTAGGGGFTDTTTDAEHPGELRVHVAEGDDFTNDKVALNGNLRLVKDGLGTFTTSKTNQKYSGGTEIVAGTLKCGTSSGNWGYGNDGQKSADSQIVTVDSGAILDINGQKGFGYMTIVFNGGTVKGASTQFNCGKIMTADSSLQVTGDITMQSHPLVMNGHTLEVTVTSAKYLKFNSCSPEGTGRIDVKSGGYLQFETQEHFSTNVDFVVGSALSMTTALNVHDYEAVFGANYNKGTAALNVFGTFKPAAHDYFYGCTMQDGSTIDLSNRAGALPGVSAFTGGEAALKFASGTVNVLASAKNATRTANGKQLISWSAIPEGVTFVPVTTAQKLVPKADGLYLEGKGFVLIVR